MTQKELFKAICSGSVEECEKVIQKVSILDPISADGFTAYQVALNESSRWHDNEDFLKIVNILADKASAQLIEVLGENPSIEDLAVFLAIGADMYQNGKCLDISLRSDCQEEVIQFLIDSDARNEDALEQIDSNGCSLIERLPSGCRTNFEQKLSMRLSELLDTETCSDDMIQEILRLLKNGARPALGKTILHLAAERGFANLVQTLINRGESLTQKDMNGKTPLEVAVDNRQIAVIEIMKKTMHVDLAHLIEAKGPSLSANDIRDRILYSKDTPESSEINMIHHALNCGVNSEALGVLISIFPGNIDSNCLDLAIDNNSAESVMLLLKSGVERKPGLYKNCIAKEKCEAANSVKEYMNMLLVESIEKCDADEVVCAIREGANVDDKGLIRACEVSTPHIVSILIHQGVQVTKPMIGIAQRAKNTSVWQLLELHRLGDDIVEAKANIGGIAEYISSVESRVNAVKDTVLQMSSTDLSIGIEEIRNDLADKIAHLVSDMDEKIEQCESRTNEELIVLHADQATLSDTNDKLSDQIDQISETFSKSIREMKVNSEEVNEKLSGQIELVSQHIEEINQNNDLNVIEERLKCVEEHAVIIDDKIDTVGRDVNKRVSVVGKIVSSLLEADTRNNSTSKEVEKLKENVSDLSIRAEKAEKERDGLLIRISDIESKSQAAIQRTEELASTLKELIYQVHTDGAIDQNPSDVSPRRTKRTLTGLLRKGKNEQVRRGSLTPSDLVGAFRADRSRSISAPRFRQGEMPTSKS